LVWSSDWSWTCTVSKLALALEVLKDGEWHSIAELQQPLELSQYQASKIALFLYEYNFAVMDDQNQKVKIHKYTREFLAQTSTY
jgi:hypothetical protein